MAEKISRSTIETYSGIAIAIFTVVFPVNWEIKLFLVCVVSGLVVDIAFRHPKTIDSHWLRKTSLAAIGIMLIALVSYRTIHKQYVDDKVQEVAGPKPAASQPALVPADRTEPKPTEPSPKPPPKKPPKPGGPRLEIGLVLGAEKRIGVDALADCKKPVYTCLSESELKEAHWLIFDIGAKGWGRLIFRVKNVGDSRLLNSMTHIESPNPISIDFAARPDPSRLPRNVLDIFDEHGIYSFSVSQAQSAIPIDIAVPEGTVRFDLNLSIFGDNMKARKDSFHFDVKR